MIAMQCSCLLCWQVDRDGWSFFDKLATFAKDVDAFLSKNDVVEHLVSVLYTARLEAVPRTPKKLSVHRLVFCWSEEICVYHKATCAVLPIFKRGRIMFILGLNIVKLGRTPDAR